MTICVRAFVCLLVTVGCGAAAAEPAAPALAPHKAVYKVSMGKAKTNSGLQDITGTLTFDWQDACDGWIAQQQTAFHFTYIDGVTSAVSSALMTWEAKDGGSFTFYVKRESDSEEDELYKGKASRDEKAVVARFTQPADTPDLTLPPETLFPTEHTLLILRKAQEGERMFSRKVFDGSQPDASDEISAFIGAQRAPEEPSDAQLAKNPLWQDKVWPVRLAVYKAGSSATAPDYEMDMAMQANGVVTRLETDYGEFSMVGMLQSLEPSAVPACGAPKKAQP